MKGFAIILACMLLGGCITATGANTASGRPERTVNLPAETAKAKVVAAMINRGFSLRSDSAARVVFFRLGDTGTGGIITAAYGVEAAFTIIPQGGSSRVMAEVSGVGNPGTWQQGGMQLNKWNGGDAAMADVNAVLAGL
jgi:hypothetical protein